MSIQSLDAILRPKGVLRSMPYHTLHLSSSLLAHLKQDYNRCQSLKYFFLLKVVGRQKTRELFKRFYKVNSLLFFLLMGVGALATALCLITLTDFIQFNCDNLPFLSYDPVKVCCRLEAYRHTNRQII